MTNKMIRIFVSSTFQDFEQERNDLTTSVFGPLSSLCRKNGFSFQIVDLRWGITDADAQANRTVQICFEEIARCQELSPAPNFLILSGFRYGWRPVPALIAGQEWRRLAAGGSA